MSRNANSLNSVEDLADHLENLLHAGKDLWWYDNNSQKHPAVTPYMRAVVEEKIAMIRAGDYSRVIEKGVSDGI